MAKNTKHFYVGKGICDAHPYLYYGENPPKIINNYINGCASDCEFIGSFQCNPIADSIKDDEIIQISIRKVKTL